MDLKGSTLYLGFSFLLVFVGTFVLVGEGALVFQSPNAFQYIAQLSLMLIPALSALAAGLFSKSVLPGPVHGIEIPTWRASLRVTMLPIAVFAIAYLVATVVGFTYPQWDLAGLLNQVEAISLQPLSEEMRAIAPAIVMFFYPFISVLMGATLFAAVAVVSEIGWRGFLLPRLMVLGAWPAHGLCGLLWGLWFIPLIYAWHREMGDFGGIVNVQLRFIALGVALSMVLGPLYGHSKSLILCGLGLGSFVGQACGIWSHLFQQTATPWTGATGWIMIGVIALSACFPEIWRGVEKPDTPS